MRWIQNSNTARETKMAVNMEATMPRESVPAKPRIGPVPNWYRMAAAMIVVRLESVIEMLALLKRSGSELLPTLTCYMLDSASNMAETARKLYVHLNTVKYRLKQIHELTGYSPTQMPGAYILCIAAAISRLRS